MSYGSELLNLKQELLRRDNKAQLTAELARRKLSQFLKSAWHVVEPSTELKWGWHLDAMCEHLEAVTAGQIKNLVVTVPPGTTKSILICQMWPAWAWATDASIRWLFAANESDLATRDSIACRYIIQSEWYTKHFPHVHIVSDQNVKTWYQTSGRGHRLATTVNSTVTGKKGDLLVCFPGDTGIETGQGVVHISEIVAHPELHKVATYNHDTNEIEYHHPVETFQRETEQLIVIELADGSTIECTPEHPIYVVGKGYIAAQDIGPDDEVLIHDTL